MNSVARDQPSTRVRESDPPGGVRLRPFDPRLLHTITEARRPVLVLAAVGAVQGGVAIAQAVATAALVVAVVRAQPMARIAMTVAALFVARGILAAAVERLGAWAGVSVSTALRRRVTVATLALPANRRPGPARLLTRLDQGPAAVEPYVARYLPALVAAVVVPVAAITTMAVLDWRIALIPVLTVPLLPLFAALIGAATADEADRRWAALAALSGHFLDVMRGMVTLVNYGRAERQAGTIREVSERVRTTTVATLRLAFLSAAALELLASLSVAVVAVFVGLALAEGRMDLAVGLPLILLAPEAYWPLRRVGTEFHAAADGAAALDDLLAVAATAGPPGPVAPPTVLPAAAAGRHLGEPVAVTGHPAVDPGRLDGVTVGHDHPLAHGLDVTLPVGLTAVVGPSGVGKSTLLEVVAGVRAPLAGTVHVPAAHLVGQRPFLVEGDIATNLALGCVVVPDRSAMERALRRVGLADVVATLPDGLASPLGDDGLGLSAGQRGRLVLARGLLSTAGVLVCDEPTAHQDDDAAALVRDVLREEAARRVVVVATHDADLLALADQVVDLASHVPAVIGSPAPAVIGSDAPAEAGSEAGRSDDRADTDATMPSGVTARSSGSTSTEIVSTDAVEADTAGSPPLRVATRVGASRDVVTAGLVGGLARACGVALTATSGWLIVAASLEPEILVLLVAIVLVRAFGIARPLLRWWERVRSHDAALGDLARRREGLWTALVPLAPARLGAHGRARLLSSLVDDLDDVVSAQVRVVVPAVAIVVATVLGVGVATWALPAASGWIVALAIGLVGAAALDLAVEQRTQDAVAEARAEVTGIATLVADEATAIRGLGPGGPDAISRRLAAAQGVLGRAVRAQSWARALGVGLVPLVVVAATLALAVVARSAVGAGLAMPVAALVVLLPLGLGEAIGGDLAAAAGEWARARAAGARLDQVVDQDPAVTDAAAGVEAPPGPTRLHLDGVGARWTDAGALLPLPDLDLRPGMHVGLVGPNGSGKSTTMAVLARHLDPEVGRHDIDGVDVRHVGLAAVRARLAIVDDEPHVFASTVRNNVLVAAPDATDEQVVGALVTAGLGEWLAGLPAELATRIGAGHRGLSGGERSRLAVARAVVSGRPVVLLDEPVAHLDHPTAVAVMADVATALVDASVVIAMHRPEGMHDLDAVRRCPPPGAGARHDVVTTG